MAQNTNVGDQTSDGAGENTTSPVSPEKGQPIAGSPQNSQEFLELRKRLDLTEKELRGLQSRQDTEKNEVQRFMAEVKKQMANGKSLEEAEAAVNAEIEAKTKDDLLLRMARKLGVIDDVSQPPAGNGGNVTNVAAQVISELKLDANAPEVVAILAKGLDPDRQELELRRYAARPRTTPTPAESLSLQTPSSTPPDANAAQARISELLNDPVRNKKEIAELQKKLNW